MKEMYHANILNFCIMYKTIYNRTENFSGVVTDISNMKKTNAIPIILNKNCIAEKFLKLDSQIIVNKKKGKESSVRC